MAIKKKSVMTKRQANFWLNRFSNAAQNFAFIGSFAPEDRAAVKEHYEYVKEEFFKRLTKDND